MEYLSLPLVLRDGYLARADLKESITHTVGLILSTRLGTMPFNPEFGCDLWEQEYTDLHVADKGRIRASLRNAIGKFEPRLYDVSVSFTTSEKTTTHGLGLRVKVTGNYREGDQDQNFTATYGLG